MKLLLLALILALLLSGTGHAFTIEADSNIEVPQTTTRQNDVTITADRNMTIFLRIADIKPWMTLSDTAVTLEQGEEKIVSIYLSPGTDVLIATHKITLIAESGDEKIEKPIFIRVTQGELLEIEKITITGDLEPTGVIELEISVKNFKSSSSQDILISGDVVSTYSIFNFSHAIARIDPSESMTFTDMFSLASYAPPGSYKVNVRLVENGEVIASASQHFDVLHKPVVRRTENVYSFIFGFSKEITVKNHGNAPLETFVLNETIGEFVSSFYFGDIPHQAENGVYFWTFSDIRPGDSVIVKYTVNYILLVVLVAIILVFLYYALFKVRTVRIRKFIMQKKIIETGSEFTVGVNINNLSGSAAEDITVSDFVPSVFAVKDTPGPQPRKRRTSVGTELWWNIKELKHGEERIFSYKIIPIFGVKGLVRLPSARVKYTKGRFKRTNRSWTAKIGVEFKEEN